MSIVISCEEKQEVVAVECEILNVLFFCFSWLNNQTCLPVNCPQNGEYLFITRCLSLHPGFCFHFLSVDRLRSAKHHSPWLLLLLLLLNPPKSAWEKTWHVPYVVTCSGSLSCWPVCTTSANPASPGTGEGLWGLWPARNVAKSSAPSSSKLTTLWQPWWRRSGPPPRTRMWKT